MSDIISAPAPIVSLTTMQEQVVASLDVNLVRAHLELDCECGRPLGDNNPLPNQCDPFGSHLDALVAAVVPDASLGLLRLLLEEHPDLLWVDLGSSHSAVGVARLSLWDWLGQALERRWMVLLRECGWTPRG